MLKIAFAILKTNEKLFVKHCQINQLFCSSQLLHENLKFHPPLDNSTTTRQDAVSTKVQSIVKRIISIEKLMIHSAVCDLKSGHSFDTFSKSFGCSGPLVFSACFFPNRKIPALYRGRK